MGGAPQARAGRALTLEDAIKEIRCPFDTKAEPLDPSFWTGPDKGGKQTEQEGIYRRLQRFAPETKKPQQGGTSAGVLARNNLTQFRPQLPPDLADFAADLETDLREHLTLPPRTIATLAEKHEDAKAFEKTLRRIFSRYRPGHFARVRDQFGTDEIIATVERH